MTVQLETTRSSDSIRRSTVKAKSGNAERTCFHHSTSWPRTSVPTASGLTRPVTWLTNSGAQYS